MTEGLSEYEKVRFDNIRRNEEFLRSLGLDSVKIIITEETVSVATTSSRKSSRNQRGNCKRKFDASVEEDTVTLRRSRRSAAANVPVIDDDLKDGDSCLLFAVGSRRRRNASINDDRSNEFIVTDDALQRDKITAPSLKEFILSLNPSHAAILKDSVSKSYIKYIILCHLSSEQL